jgi:hypothetical protein
VSYQVASRGRVIGTTELDFARIGGRSRSGWFHPNAEGERLMPVVASVLPAMRAYLHRDVRLDDGRPVVRPELEGSTLFADLAEALHHASTLDLTLHREDGSLVPTELVGIQDTEQLLRMADLVATDCLEREERDQWELGPPPWELELPSARDELEERDEWELGPVPWELELPSARDELEELHRRLELEALEEAAQLEDLPFDEDDEEDFGLVPTTSGGLQYSIVRYDPESGRFESLVPAFEMPPVPRYQIHVMLVDDAAVP